MYNKILTVPKLRPTDIVKPILMDLISLGNNSPINKWKIGKTPIECAETVQSTNARGRNPSESRNELSSECVFKYDKVAKEMSAKMLTETQLTKRTLLDARLIIKLESAADKTWNERYSQLQFGHFQHIRQVKTCNLSHKFPHL